VGTGRTKRWHPGRMLPELVNGPADGIPIREEAYPSLKAFTEKVLPELKQW
jgi:hypothetical protein